MIYVRIGDYFMAKNITIGIIACDLRQLYMAKYLVNKGYIVNLIYSESLSTHKDFKETLRELVDFNEHIDLRVVYDIDEIINYSNIIIAPIPFNKISEFIVIPKFIAMLKDREDLSSFFIYAGLIDEETKNLLENSKIKYIDYSKSEKLAIYNSIATAEGIIAEAIISKNTNLHKSRTLVLGYGKCGKTLARKLKGLDAHVTVCARKEEDLELAYSMGFETISLHNLIMEINKYEYIFNTIPEMIIKEELFKKMNDDCIILDIASVPGGVDKNVALKYGVCVKHILGIPGKYASKSSGEAMALDLLKLIK